MDGTGLEWAARVQRLEAEVDGLRRAMRSRAVIEQAKGFLSAALNCGLDEAFGHLARLSQHENLRVAEVAARIIGTVIPTEDDGSPDGGEVDTRLFDPLTYLHGASPGNGTADDEPAQSVRLPALPAETRVRLQTAAAAIQSAESFAALADRTLDEGLGWLVAESLTIWTAEPDGALRMVACAGLSPQVASDWQRIPSRVRAPVRDAIAIDQPVWLTGEERNEYEIMRDGVGAASLPLRYDGRPYGGISLLWPGTRHFTELDQRYLTGLAALVGRRYRQLARSSGQPAAPGHWLQGVLDSLPVASFLLNPVRDGKHRIVDFVIDYASPLAGEPTAQQPVDLVGRRLLDVRPELADNGVFQAYRQVAQVGDAWQQDAQPELVLVDGATEQRTISRSAIRLGQGLLVSWRVHDVEAQLTRLSRVEDLADLGYFEWDLVSGIIYWSPGMYRIFDRSPQRGPIPLEQVPDHVVPDDVPILENDLRSLLERRRPTDTVLRIRRGGGDRSIRAIVRPVVDGHRDLVGVYGVVQDLTELNRRTEAQRRSEHAAKVRRIHGAVSPRHDW